MTDGDTYKSDEYFSSSQKMSRLRLTGQNAVEMIKSRETCKKIVHAFFPTRVERGINLFPDGKDRVE